MCLFIESVASRCIDSVTFLSPAEVLVASSHIDLWDQRIGNLNCSAKLVLPQDGKTTPIRIWDVTTASGTIVAAGDSHALLFLPERPLLP